MIYIILQQNASISSETEPNLLLQLSAFQPEPW
jgi:hypothetical protein